MTRALFPVATLILLFAAACSDDNSQPNPTSTSATSPTEEAAAPGANERVTLRGNITIDGAPLNTDFLGARVIRNGLNAACQGDIPAVSDGRYEITVVSDKEVRGCGADGAQIVLWGFANGAYVYTQQSVAWPGNSKSATFDATLSSASPLGATKPATELKGQLYDANGIGMPEGSVVEAYIGQTLCGVTSLRYGNVTEGFYTLIVAGPEAIPACVQGATITFRVHDRPVRETAVNDLRSGSNGAELDLTLQ